MNKALAIAKRNAARLKKYAGGGDIPLPRPNPFTVHRKDGSAVRPGEPDYRREAFNEAKRSLEQAPPIDRWGPPGFYDNRYNDTPTPDAIAQEHHLFIGTDALKNLGVQDRPDPPNAHVDFHNIDPNAEYASGGSTPNEGESWSPDDVPLPKPDPRTQPQIDTGQSLTEHQDPSTLEKVGGFLRGLNNSLGAVTFTRPEDIQAMRSLVPKPVDTALANSLQSQAGNDALGVVGGMGIFAGPRAATADLKALSRAQAMDANGASDTKIWKETGWGPYPNGKPFFEIPDANAKLTKNWESTGEQPTEKMVKTGGRGEVHSLDPNYWYRIQDVLDHPDLYKAYPNLFDDWRVRMAAPGEFSNGVTGSVNSADKSMVLAPQPANSARDTLLHEINHIVQEHEGFPAGANVQMFLPDSYRYFSQAYTDLGSQLYDYFKKANIDPAEADWAFERANLVNHGILNPDDITPGAHNILQRMKNDGVEDVFVAFQRTKNWLENQSALAKEKYFNAIGEASSRNVEYRSTIDPNELRGIPPWETQKLMHHPVHWRDMSASPLDEKGKDQMKNPVRQTINRAFGGMVPGERAMIPRPPHMSRLGSNDSLRNPSIRPPSGVMRPPHPVSVTHSNVGMQPPRMVNPVRESMPKMPKAGGIKGMGMAKPPMAKSIMPKAGGMVHPPHAGMIHSTIPGRTDKIPMGVKGGSYVIPADVVSGIGEGNSMAGANAFNKLFKMGPYGAATNKLATPKVNMGHMGGLRPPMGVHAAGQGQFGMEEGGTPGNEGDHIPIIAAGGEFVVPPDRLRAVIHPDLKKAHDTMDHLVLHLRKKTIHETRHLKGPKKN